MFEGTGKLPGGPYRIQLKCDVQQVQHPPRAVPEKKKPTYEEEPESLELENVAAHSYLSGVQGQLLELPCFFLPRRPSVDYTIEKETRKTEHFQALTKGRRTSAIADHISSTGHNIKWHHFEILRTGNQTVE